MPMKIFSALFVASQIFFLGLFSYTHNWHGIFISVFGMALAVFITVKAYND
jgi:hypothetical protein